MDIAYLLKAHEAGEWLDQLQLVLIDTMYVLNETGGVVAHLDDKVVKAAKDSLSTIKIIDINIHT